MCLPGTTRPEGEPIAFSTPGGLQTPCAAVNSNRPPLFGVAEVLEVERDDVQPPAEGETHAAREAEDRVSVGRVQEVAQQEPVMVPDQAGYRLGKLLALAEGRLPRLMFRGPLGVHFTFRPAWSLGLLTT